MTLFDLIQLYGTLRRTSDGYLYQLRRSAALYGEHLNRPASTEDLQDEPVSAWLRDLERTHAQRTTAGHRGNLLVLWRFAARRKLCEYPGEVRRVPRPAPMPQAWTLEQMRSLVAATERIGGETGRYFHALVLCGYESGLRRGDLWSLRRCDIGRDGTIAIRQHKTGSPHLVAIRPETAELILSLPGDTPLACPWSPKWYGRLWARLCQVAGVPRGGCQRLRRTGATWIAAEHGTDAASRWLGHRTAGMVRYYLDVSLASPRPSMPPRLAS